MLIRRTAAVGSAVLDPGLRVSNATVISEVICHHVCSHCSNSGATGEGSKSEVREIPVSNVTGVHLV